jgi:hypothetical protein
LPISSLSPCRSSNCLCLCRFVELNNAHYSLSRAVWPLCRPSRRCCRRVTYCRSSGFITCVSPLSRRSARRSSPLNLADKGHIVPPTASYQHESSALSGRSIQTNWIGVFESCVMRDSNCDFQSRPESEFEFGSCLLSVIGRWGAIKRAGGPSCGRRACYARPSRADLILSLFRGVVTITECQSVGRIIDNEIHKSNGSRH